MIFTASVKSAAQCHFDVRYLCTATMMANLPDINKNPGCIHNIRPGICFRVVVAVCCHNAFEKLHRRKCRTADINDHINCRKIQVSQLLIISGCTSRDSLVKCLMESPDMSMIIVTESTVCPFLVEASFSNIRPMYFATTGRVRYNRLMNASTRSSENKSTPPFH